MPRDANGIYSLPLPAVAAGTTITTLWGNTTTQDIAAALTDSLSRTAQGGMSGPLRLTSGTAGAPSLAFVDQVGLGLYRSASGVMNFTVDGTTYVRFNALNQLEVLRDEGGGAQWWPVATTAGLGGAFFDYLQGYAVGGLHIEYVGNLNAITFNSKWAITKASVTNPPAGLAGSLAVIETDMWVAGTTEAVQTITGMDAANTGQIFIRTKVANFWGAWVEISSSAIAANTANINTLLARPPPKVTVFTADNLAWVPTAGARSIKFTVTGAGGGGGSVDGQGVNTAALSVGGAGGGTVIKTVNAPFLASYEIKVGAGGAGGAGAGGANGQGGGSSWVRGPGGDTLNINSHARGGDGGGGSVATAANNRLGGATGGIASGGDINLGGGGSNASFVVTAEQSGGSVSGASYWGGGVVPRAGTGNDGVAASTIGEGGGAAAVLNDTVNNNGGAGFRGVCVVEEYF